ncbi:MAG: thioredoxin-like domain-containing protein [Verrucomicrobiota bacterium]
MKIPTIGATLLIALSGLGQAEDFRRWHDITGRQFEAKLTDVSATEATLENRDGKSIQFSLADLRPSDRSYARDWQSANSTKTGGEASTGAALTPFGDKVYKDLVRLDGKRLKRYKPELTASPKYFAFYRSAQWCPPCRKFTPGLVDFYDAQKAKGAPFELVFMSRDRDEAAMEGYMQEYAMNWPAFKHGKMGDLIALNGTGIPNLIVTDAEGNKLLDSYDENGEYRGPTVVMRELEKLLEQ